MSVIQRQPPPSSLSNKAPLSAHSQVMVPQTNRRSTLLLKHKREDSPHQRQQLPCVSPESSHNAQVFFLPHYPSLTTYSHDTTPRPFRTLSIRTRVKTPTLRRCLWSLRIMPKFFFFHITKSHRYPKAAFAHSAWPFNLPVGLIDLLLLLLLLCCTALLNLFPQH